MGYCQPKLMKPIYVCMYIIYIYILHIYIYILHITYIYIYIILYYIILYYIILYYIILFHFILYYSILYYIILYCIYIYYTYIRTLVDSPRPLEPGVRVPPSWLGGWLRRGVESLHRNLAVAGGRGGNGSSHLPSAKFHEMN